ncbi:peroxiredoxin family protein [Nonlabens dokdonensis]|uniref:AhpC-TSA domain containing protein n=2 Tax=Nonlabens dokdonensis TaxID=328515 RepID=L7W8P6_NONDD|nr:redoxin domain-containing protein [Nonlabens dokdonensis]AGC76592.1 AhpC-TSA domain containing protein [Nonlabens dokdonensis DSW-6]
MKKKIVILSLAVLVISILSFLGVSIISKANNKKEIAAKLQHIPDFKFQQLNGQSFSNVRLKDYLNTIFIYYNSECDYCQHEAESISENLDSFKNVQFLFVSSEPIETIKEFSQTYSLDQQSNIYFLHDRFDIFSTRFDATSIPYLLIYNENQELIKRQKGQLNAKGILKLLKTP